MLNYVCMFPHDSIVIDSTTYRKSKMEVIPCFEQPMSLSHKVNTEIGHVLLSYLLTYTGDSPLSNQATLLASLNTPLSSTFCRIREGMQRSSFSSYSLVEEYMCSSKKTPPLHYIITIDIIFMITQTSHV